MADNFADFYSGNMAPPLKLPGGGYAPAPSMQQQMTPEEIYQGIYGEPISTGLTSRSVKTVAIDPYTGMPATNSPQVASNPLPKAPAPSMQANMYGRGQPMPIPANQPSGTIALGKDQSRLTPNAFGYGTNGPSGGNAATAAIETAAPRQTRFDPRGGAIGSFADMQGQFGAPPVDDGIIDLGEAFSPKAGQGFADSEGKPVRIKGVVYYPGGKAPAGKVSATLGQNDTRGPLSRALGLKTSGLGGLLGGLFGGMNTANAGRAGASTVPGLGALLSGGGSSFGSSPSQGMAMTVDPNTSTGSTLSGMGFSPGAAVPAATIRSLSERGYF